MWKRRFVSYMCKLVGLSLYSVGMIVLVISLALLIVPALKSLFSVGVHWSGGVALIIIGVISVALGFRIEN